MSETLSFDEAYRAAFYFLEAYYQRGKSDEIAGLLGAMSLLQDGGSADPAQIMDFRRAVEKAKQTSSEDIRSRLSRG